MNIIAIITFITLLYFFQTTYLSLYVISVAFFILVKKFDKNNSFFLNHDNLNKIPYTDIFIISITIFPSFLLFFQHFFYNFIPVKKEYVEINNILHLKTEYLNGDIQYKVNGKFHREDYKPARFINHKYRSQYWWKGKELNLTKHFHETKFVDENEIKKIIIKDKISNFI